ncbi:MAG: DUF460 domain-containing protein [Candidatus Aenigmatarchaeota archaeon]
MTRDRERGIVGIDPGSTSAIAILDLRGNLQRLESEKHMGKERIIRVVSSECKPVLITSDKGKMPSGVEEIASNFGAETFVPGEDLSIRGKKELTREYDFANLHERDALAAALNAYNSFKNKFDNIEARMDELNLQDLSPEVKELVIMDEARNVSEAVEKALGDEEKEEEERKGEEKKTISRANLEEKIDNYRRIIMRERKDKEKLKEHNEKLKKETEELKGKISELKEEKEGLEKGVKDDILEKRELKKLKRNLRSKESRIDTLEGKRKELEKRIRNLKTFEELRKEGKIPLRDVNVLSENRLRKEDNKLSLENSILLVKKIRGDVENLVEILNELGVKAVVGSFSEESADKFISEGLWASPTDEIEIKERKGVKYMEESEVEGMKGEGKESFMGWLKRYRDKNA